MPIERNQPASERLVLLGMLLVGSSGGLLLVNKIQ